MRKVLVSACLLGRKVRYNGSDKRSNDAILARWLEEGRVVPVCPEVAAGLPTPRPPAEIRDAADGTAVLAGRGRVVEASGRDVTALYRSAAGLALALAQAEGCTVAVLTDGSPSCGSSFIHDGRFRGATVPGHGTTTALLEASGIRVFSERQLAEADLVLRVAASG
ncbi:MAG: DUF523 domain-containing protein [Geminicoccaceae bacterium]